MSFVLELWQLVDPLTIRFATDLVIAIVLAIAIGGERELRGKDAGISTNALVLCGSMLFTFLSMHVDPESTSRIAAQIVTGIGFLGAGLIIRDGVSVRNLTTAASIWFSAAIGMAIGFGYHAIPVIATVASIIIARFPHMRTGRIDEDDYVIAPIVATQKRKK